MRKKPTFRSDRYQFTVVMPNLNYGVLQNVPQSKLDNKILNLIKKNKKISTEDIAIEVGVSARRKSMTRQELVHQIEQYKLFNEQEEMDKHLILEWIKKRQCFFQGK